MLSLEVSDLQQLLLHLDVSIQQQTVLSWEVSGLQQLLLHLDLSIQQETVLSLECLAYTAASAASGRVYSTVDRDVLGDV